MEYKKKHSFEERIKECREILQKHPETIPIILEKNKNSKLETPNKKKLSLFYFLKTK